MGKARTFRAVMNFKGKRVRYDKSYVKGRIFQMAKFICTNDDGNDDVVRIATWKMKNGHVVEYLITVKTKAEKFFDFLDKVESTYPGLIKQFDATKSRN